METKASCGELDAGVDLGERKHDIKRAEFALVNATGLALEKPVQCANAIGDDQTVIFGAAGHHDDFAVAVLVFVHGLSLSLEVFGD